MRHLSKYKKVNDFDIVTCTCLGCLLYIRITQRERREKRREERDVCIPRMCTCTPGVNRGNRRESQPVKDGADTRTVSTAPVDMEACGQQDAILDRNRAVGEGSNQQFIPPCEHREETLWGEQPQSYLLDSRAMHGLPSHVMKTGMKILGGSSPAQGDTYN